MLLYLWSSDSDPYRLLVISEPSNAISTPPMLPLLIPYLPLPFKKREILRTFLPRPYKTLYHFNLTHTVFPFILRFSSHFISFAPISLDLLLLISDYVYGHTHSLTYPYPISIEPISPFYTTSLHHTLTRN
jgi:hypothetical protein